MAVYELVSGIRRDLLECSFVGFEQEYDIFGLYFLEFVGRLTELSEPGQASIRGDMKTTTT